MDDPNITMEEYIRLEKEKARRSAIVYNDAFTSKVTFSFKPTYLTASLSFVNLLVFIALLVIKTLVMPITTVEEKVQRRLEVKARSTLMMGIPNEHRLKFNSINDVKQLLEAVEKKIWLQRRVSQLELLDEKLSQEDVNQKLLRSLSPEWNTHAVVWRNKADLDTMSMNDLYNNLKVYELEVKGMSSSSSSTNNMAFVSSSNNNSSNANGAVNTANGVSAASTQVNAAYFTNINNLSDSDQAEEGPNYALTFSSSSSDSKVTRHGIQLNVEKNEHASKSLNKLIECQIVDNYKKDLGYKNYNAVPPPYTGNFMPPTPDLSFTGLDEFVNKYVVKNCKAKSSEEEQKVVRKNDDALIIKEWVSDDEEENVSQLKIEKKTVRPSIVKEKFVKSKQQEKTARKTVKQVEHHRQNTHSPRGNQKN
nr:hypothetical protein [Tanacetum cinerariifolium]